METETLNAILLFLGAVVVAVLFVYDRLGKRLNESIPPNVMPLFLGLLSLAETLAAQTPTTADDELIERIKTALNAPAEEPTAPQTAEELDARLNGTGAQG